jgi:isopropylmalate/homocitrate/citramalate synthase
MTMNIRSRYPALPAEVEVIDCTLRDGEQAPGVWFTLEEKLELARDLSEAGVALLDAGFPASSEADMEALQEMRRMKLSARIGATARPVRRDIAAAARARAEDVFMFMPTSDFRLTETLGITRSQASALFCSGAEDVVGHGMALSLVFEDATRADPRLLIDMVRDVSYHVPVRRVVICDTVGCAYPGSIEQLITHLRQALPDETVLCTHSHNDLGLATANTVTAVAAGARAVTCTVNGIGERAGNADLAETVAALTHIYGVEHRVRPGALPALAAKVERMSGMHASPHKPVTGFNVFRHESGVHVDGMLKNARSYEFVPASWVERETEYVLGKHSGTSIIRHLLKQSGQACTQEEADALLCRLKRASADRKKEAHARAYESVVRFRQDHLSGLDPEVILADVPHETQATVPNVATAQGGRR